MPVHHRWLFLQEGHIDEELPHQAFYNVITSQDSVYKCSHILRHWLVIVRNFENAEIIKFMVNKVKTQGDSN